MMTKLIAIEEHFMTPEITSAWTTARDAERDLDRTNDAIAGPLVDLGEGRLEAMDSQGVDVQVLSAGTPGVQNLDAATAVRLARAANDTLAAAVRAHPDHFEGFATVPTPDPQAAADELRRMVAEHGFKGALVNGRAGAMNVDHPDMEPFWAAAAELRCPVYLHPQQPVTQVRDAYYSNLGFGPTPDWIMGGPLIGWHYETGIQVLRLVLSGTFDKFPDLQIVTGHWGEVVLFYVDRMSEMKDRVPQAWLERPLLDYFRHNISYTGSGILNQRYFRWTKELVGAQRILYATDYPYIDTSNRQARRFFDEADLTDDEREDIGHRNWERLTEHLG